MRLMAAVRSGIAAVLLALPVFAGLALAIAGTPLPIDAADGALVAWRTSLTSSAVLDVLDAGGSIPAWLVLVGGLGLWLVRSDARLALEATLVFVVAEVAVAVVKLVIGRARPLGADVTDLFITAGFPSGHVTRAAVFAGVVLTVVPWLSRRPKVTIGLGIIVVLAMAVARVSAGAHHSSDVLGGLLLASIIVATWAVTRRPRA